MEQSNLAKLISNYGSKLWSMISVFVFIPLYIQYLGTENYGLIGFYALLLGIISFADSGMSSAIIREFSQDADTNYKFSVFRKLENTYLVVCIGISLVITLLSNYIVEYWITSQEIPKEQLVYYVRLIGVGATTQLISSLYYGALFASNQQVRSNLLQLLWSFSRSAIVLILFIVFYSSIELYFIWQIVCNVLYVLILRYFIIKQLQSNLSEGKLSIQFKKLPKHITSYIGGMIFIAIISAINIQADKLVTSKLFDLTTFGFYNIASSIAQLPIIFAAPLIAFAFPLFTKFSNSDQIENIKKNQIVFNKIFYLINVVSIIITTGVFFYAKELLLLWTKNMIPLEIFPAIIFDAKILIIGSFFMALQFPLYYLLLSKGKTKYTVYQGVAQILIGIPLLYYFIKSYGLYGVPFIWLIINLFALIYLAIIVEKKYLEFISFKFLCQLILSPIVIAIFVNYFIYYIFQHTNQNFIIFAIFGSVISFILSILLNNVLSKNSLFTVKNLYNFPNE